ncbi:MAG: hypothetical protein RDU25_00600 [Patescibacteria group bacterium]|nr:hypothetical protein [Patescibacteria group bacterium]
MDVMVSIVLGTSLVANVVLVYLMVARKSHGVKMSERNRRLGDTDISSALPPRSRLSLKERMADLGLEFHHEPTIVHISEDIRHNFTQTTSREALCRRCQNYVDLVRSSNPAINPSGLGFFCICCGEGRLFQNIELIRKANRLPSLPDSNLFAILDVLECFALKNGLIHEPTSEKPQLVTFDVALQETAGYRGPPLKARVDVEAQTVVLVDETVQPKSLRLVK